MFFFFAMICIHFNCYTPIDVHLIMCALCEKKMIEKINAPKKEQNIIFLNVIPTCFYFDYFYFDMCFDKLIKFYA